jgi:hypothetical protein
MADNLVSEGEEGKLHDAFEQSEASEMGPGAHERYDAIMGECHKAAAGWGWVFILARAVPRSALENRPR